MSRPRAKIIINGEELTEDKRKYKNIKIEEINKLSQNKLEFCERVYVDKENIEDVYRDIWMVPDKNKDVRKNINTLRNECKHYIRLIQKNNREKSQMDRLYILEKLRFIIEENYQDSKTTQNALKAIDLVCKMNGLYEPEKIDVNHSITGINITINKAKRIENYDDYEELE